MRNCKLAANLGLYLNYSPKEKKLKNQTKRTLTTF